MNKLLTKIYDRESNSSWEEYGADKSDIDESVSAAGCRIMLVADISIFPFSFLAFGFSHHYHSF